MKIRMVPVEQLFKRTCRASSGTWPKRVKGNCHRNGRQNTDLDKSVLDALAESRWPHPVRNAADHGIEAPEERLVLGQIRPRDDPFDAYHQENQVVIEVSDDGAESI